jgi:hypothetical protein
MKMKFIVIIGPKDTTAVNPCQYEMKLNSDFTIMREQALTRLPGWRERAS